MLADLIMSIKRISPSSFFFLGLLTVVLSQHTAGKHRRETYACEGQTLKISCGESSDGQHQRIRVLRANYGRFSIALCNPNGVVGWSTKCMSATSTQVLIERCAEKASCSVDVADKTFGDDPCRGTDKYLEVHYECTSEPQTTIPEPQSFLPATSLPSVFQSRVFAVTTTTPTTTTTTSPTTTSTTTSPSTTTTTATLPVDPVTDEYLIASSTSDESTIKPIQTRARHQPVQSKQSSSNQVTEFCPPVLRNNILWPRTPKGATAFEMCPRESKSYAEWSCDDQSPPQWRGLPDLSQCTSQWIDSFRREAGSDIPAEKVAENFAKQTAKEVFSSGSDVANAVEIITKLVGRASKRLTKGSDEEEHDVSVQKLGENVLKAGSNLLDVKHNVSWEELGYEAKAQTATTLLNSLESTAFMLAENVPVGTILTSSDRNIIMGAGKLQTKTLAQSYRFPVNEEQFPRERISRSNIEFPASVLQQYSTDNVVKVVFLSFNNIGDYLSSEIPNKKIFNGEYVVNSKVITATLNNGQQKTTLKENVIITLEHKKPMLPGQKGVCAFWEHGVNKKEKTFVGRWSAEGCQVVSQNADQTVCSCNHLTNFAVLMDTSEVTAVSAYSSSLFKVTVIGCSISIICLFLTLVILCSIRSLQSERTTIHRNLTFCLLIAEVFFLAGISQTQLPVGCHIFSVFMHYFFLATFMWCLFDGLHLYLLLVEVFEPEKSRRMWYYLAGYGVPLVVVSVCLGVDWTSYATAEYCWLRADNYFILGFVIPVGLTVIANLFFLSVALYFMCKSIGLKSALHARDPTTYKQLKTWICAAFGLVFVMAATWIFGFMYLANLQTVVFAYVFTFLNSFQGVLIFFLLCYKNEKVRAAMRQLTTDMAERLSRCFCSRSRSMFSDNNGPTTDGPSFYQSAPPLDKEQQYITNYPTYWHTQLTRPTDISRRSTVTSTLPPHSPPIPQCTCEAHDYQLHPQQHNPSTTIEKTSSRSSNRDSGHESASCPSADSPPMHATHIHQRTLYPPSFTHTRKSICPHSIYNPRLASRLYYGDVEHIYAEIESQHACMDEQCPYSDASDESNTSVYHRTGSDVSTDSDRCHHLTAVTVDEEGRVVPVFHNLEQKPLIKSLGPNNTINIQHCQRHCAVPSAFRSLSKPNAHAKLRQAAVKNQPVIFSNVMAETGPYINTMLDGNSGGNYNAFGLTSLRDGSKMVRRLPLMAKSAHDSGPQGPVPFSEC